MSDWRFSCSTSCYFSGLSNVAESLSTSLQFQLPRGIVFLVGSRPLPHLESHLAVCIGMGVGTNFGVGVEEARPEGPRVEVGFLERGQPAPPHQLGRLRERCKFPQRGSGAEPQPPKGFLVF